MASQLKLEEILYPTSTTPAITINADNSVTIPTQSTTTVTTTGNVTVGGTLTVGGGALSPQTGFKNRVINGAMTIDQRNGGASVTPADGQYTLDRWIAYRSQSSKYSVQQDAGAVTPPAGFIDYLGVTSLSAYSSLAADYFGIAQFIEGFNIADLGWGTASAQTVTISFWVRASLTGTYPVAFQNSAGNRGYLSTYTISAANTWEYKTITILGDTTGTWLTNNGKGIRVWFDLGSGSDNTGTANVWGSSSPGRTSGSVSVVGTNGATFYVTGVQLEAGSAASPFEFRSIGQEEILCYRYFQTYSNPPLRGVFAGGTSPSRCGMVLPVVMRAQPTATVGALTMFDGGSISTVSSVQQAYLSTKAIEFDLNTVGALTTGRPAIVYMSGTTNNLSVSAEL